jgi:hypothetical protein
MVQNDFFREYAELGDCGCDACSGSLLAKRVCRLFFLLLISSL